MGARLRRWFPIIATVVPAAICAFVVVDPLRGFKLFTVGHVTAIVLLAAVVKSTRQRKFRFAALQAAVLALLLAILFVPTTSWVGHAEVALRLTLTGWRQREPPRVYWWGALPDRTGVGYSAWKSVHTMGDASFASGSMLDTEGLSNWYFSCSSWSLNPPACVIVVAGEQTLSFDAGFLFGRRGRGQPPRKLDTTFDIGEYLSGAKPLPPAEAAQTTLYRQGGEYVTTRLPE
ncbi:MAG TPA: hypothetical protein VMF30_20080 [Pirellulales bacterium]|nr:hypothetical protein [Pirellulales bacterium]